jgi:hypothetical protein
MNRNAAGNAVSMATTMRMWMRIPMRPSGGGVFAETRLQTL